MAFSELCNSIISNLLFESVNRTYIPQVNAEIEVIKNRLKGNRGEFKKEMKLMKKKFISNLVKNNHDSLLVKFFPNLIEKKDVSDDGFYALLFDNPENWSGMTEGLFREFASKMESIIVNGYRKNHHQHDNLKYLRHDYLR